MNRMRENAGLLVTLLTIVGLAFAAWFTIWGTFTPIERHEALASEVKQVAVRSEKLKLQNDLRWFQFQYRTNCKTRAQRSTENCLWMASEIKRIEADIRSL